KSFQRRSVAAVEYRLFAPKIARRKGRKDSTEMILRNMKIGLLDGSRVSDALLAFGRKRGFDVNVGLRATSNIQLVQAVKESYCAAVLPTIARSQFSEGTFEEWELRELKRFDHTIIAAQPKQRAMVRAIAARGATFLLDIMSRHK